MLATGYNWLKPGQIYRIMTVENEHDPPKGKIKFAKGQSTMCGSRKYLYSPKGSILKESMKLKLESPLERGGDGGGGSNQ